MASPLFKSRNTFTALCLSCTRPGNEKEIISMRRMRTMTSPRIRILLIWDFDTYRIRSKSTFKNADESRGARDIIHVFGLSQFHFPYFGYARSACSSEPSLLVDAISTKIENIVCWRPFIVLFVCLIWFFTSHQQSFSYVGTGLPGLNQY